MEELRAADGDVPRRLDADRAKVMNLETLPMHESAFRWMMNEDAMVTEKLAEGIRNFANDALKLEEFVCAKYSWAKRNAANCKYMGCGSKSRVLTLGHHPLKWLIILRSIEEPW